MNPATITLLAALFFGGVAGGCAKPEGDAARGAQLHNACLGCHGTEVYQPPRAKVTTERELREQVEIWNDRMNPKFTEQEVEDITVYLNTEFYKL